MSDNYKIIISEPDNPSQRNCQNQLSQPSLSRIEQKYQAGLIQGKIHIQQNSNKDLKFW